MPSPKRSRLPRCYETKAAIAASPEVVFAHVDDHARLASHMSQSSWKMGGGKMTIEFDEDHGQAVGSRIRLSGCVLGMNLSVEEVVVERTPPQRKSWETVGSPKLLVIGHYRMGFDIAPQGEGSLLCVFIEYALPPSGLARWLGWIFSGFYARWCVRQMVFDTAKHFEQSNWSRVLETQDGQRRALHTASDAASVHGLDRPVVGRGAAKGRT
jgi:hypothetical protein